MSRYIEHLTLDTGHQRRSYRDEVHDDIVSMLRPLLDRVAAGERVAVPGAVDPAGCTMRGAVGRDRALVVTVSGPPGDLEIEPPLVTIAVAPSSLASAELWRTLLGCERDDRTPSPPWCCVRMQVGIALHPDAAGWLGDLERCIAWSWIR